MRLFKCQSCGQLLYFENTKCERCGHVLGYAPETAILHALEPAGSDWHPVERPERLFRLCENAEQGTCNWLIPAASTLQLCSACRHNRNIPDLSDPENLWRWSKMEIAKHRLFYSLLRLNLPLVSRMEDSESGLAFDFVAQPGEDGESHLLTGHKNGVVTINLAEADDREREKQRAALAEPYRTLLGHFRHEIGHYYWDRLVRDGGWLEPCRALFGDERRDYNQALESHYESGPPADWQETYVSAYAASHPWEDFAETWAHYLHIADTLEMARAFGLHTNPNVHQDENLSAAVDFDPFGPAPAERLVEAWLPLTLAMNAINRAMGKDDLYPFILSPPAIEKLGFISRIIHEAAPPPDPTSISLR